MACGNNMVSRSGLQSAPAPLVGPSGSGGRRVQLPPPQLTSRRENARQAMDRAERAAASAADPLSAGKAVKDARRALDSARRLPGRSRERAALLRELEGKVAKVEQAADRADARARSERDQMSRQWLGVVAASSPPPTETSPSPPRSATVAMGLQEELGELLAGKGGNQQVGDFAEAVASGLNVLTRDHEILQQHHPKASPHGLDIETLDQDGKVWAFEVKGTRVVGRQPGTSQYAVGNQGSASYVSDRSGEGHVVAPGADAVGVDADQMGSMLITVNLPDNEVKVWELDVDGKRAQTPLETHRLDDVVRRIDDNNT